MRVRPPGIEWKTGRHPKMDGKKIGQKIENGPRPEKGKNGEKMEFGVIFSFFRHFWAVFSPISGRGPFSIFWPIFCPFLDFGPARFPFYTRRPDSQVSGAYEFPWNEAKEGLVHTNFP